MPSVISNYWGNSLLAEWLSDRDNYLALHTSNPGVAGDSSTEIAVAGYSRQLIDFGSASAKTVGNSNALLFSSVPAVTITHMGVWTDPVAGQLLFSIQLTTPITPLTVTNLSVLAGDVAVTL